jgi:homoprotocatechuate degradation regulator HpaR
MPPSAPGPTKGRLKNRNLPLLLLQSRERVLSYFRATLNAHGITEQQWRIVRVLIEVSALEPRQIGELCGISSPSLAGVLERMEQLGLIERRRVTHDQRRVHVSVTPTAKRLAGRMAPEINATYDRIQERIGPELWQRVQQTLDDLIEALPMAEPL